MTVEQKIDAANPAPSPDVNITQNVSGNQSVQVETSVEDVKNAQAINEGKPADTAETLGVSEAQYAKFYKPDTGYNWQAHAKELEWQASQKATQPTETAPEAPEGEEPKATGDEVKEVVEGLGVDWEGLNDQIRKTGQLSAESVDELVSKGMPKDVVETYAKYAAQEYETHRTNVTEYLGGANQYAKIQELAEAHLSADEIQKLSAGLGDPDNWQKAADAVLTHFGLPRGNVQGTTLIFGDNASPASAAQVLQPYASVQEQIADQRNPQYKIDPAFREQVAKRIAASNYSHSRSGFIR